MYIRMCTLYVHYSNNKIYVTGFGKTIPVHTRIEIHLLLIIIATLKRYPDTATQLLYIRRSAFTDGFLSTLSSHVGPTQTLWGPWDALLG